MDHEQSFASWLKQQRKARDLTQSDLAGLIGCALVTLQKIEEGRRRPSKQVAELLAHHLAIAPAARDAFLRRARAEPLIARSTSSTPVSRMYPPTPPTALIGREHELAQICALLRTPAARLVTLTGPGGIGKTHLALQLAAQLLDDFPDGVYFVDLAPIRDPALVISAIAQTLGIKETGGQPLMVQLKHFLGGKCLLLLDNFEQVLDAAPLVAELLTTAAQLKVLVTSREVLHVRGEKEAIVPPLALPERADDRPFDPVQDGRPTTDDQHVPARADTICQYAAVALFVERTQAVKADFVLTNATAGAVAEICVRLDGLPLAIELAAARVKLLAPAALLARLTSRLDLLTGGARDLPARQQTMRNTIAWSYELLSEVEQTLFRRLSVFVGGCTLAAAERVLRTEGRGLSEDRIDSVLRPPSSVLDGLAALVDKSLLRQSEDPGGAPRFVMLETIHEYALERLEASGEAERLHRNHAAYYQALGEHVWATEDGPQGGGAWVRRLQPEYDNFRSALAWSQTTAGDSEMALQLSSALDGLWSSFGVRHEAIAAMERSLSHPLG
ncbi:MAG: helix-turn-helix domain-containing protein, partial [Chloroflexota bacterium]|nr:helix-turn-helix domain-containing protein [Chloroflexota bacterium]